jgi:serine/threonine protein kinase
MRFETGQYFYAMELIEGETLDERVRRTGPLSVRSVVTSPSVTAALATVEKRGLVHRDLKPANLMLVSRWRNDRFCGRNNEKVFVKIIDFGLASALNAPVDPNSLTHEICRHAGVRQPGNLNILRWTCARHLLARRNALSRLRKNAICRP